MPVISTLWFTCWLRFTPELPAARMNVWPAAADAELLALDALLSFDPPCCALVRMYWAAPVADDALVALESGREGVVLLRPTVLELPSQLCRHPVTVTVRPLSELDGAVDGCELCCAARVRLLSAAIPQAATMCFVMTICLLV